MLAAFNVVHELSEAEYKRLYAFRIDVESYSKRKHRKIARAAMFLVDEQGKVMWAHASLDYKLRPSLEQVLTAITPLVAKP